MVGAPKSVNACKFEFLRLSIFEKLSKNFKNQYHLFRSANPTNSDYSLTTQV